MTSIPLVLRRVSALTLLFAAFTTHAAGLPDTGQTLCYDDTAAVGVASEPTGFLGQDCSYGRDMAGAAKTGASAGTNALDYTKIANNGSIVAAGTLLGTGNTDWACTKDNITGLMWEVKTTSGLRSKAHTYTWFSSNTATNGGNVGTPDPGSGSTCATVGRCDTEKFVADVNTATLCSYADWRMPTVRELLTLVLLDGTSPSIDPTYFPQTNTSDYWTASTYVSTPANAWVVSFDTTLSKGGVSAGSGISKSNAKNVRLVRGGPF